jgi:hypothetical protein
MLANKPAVQRHPKTEMQKLMKNLPKDQLPKDLGLLPGQTLPGPPYTPIVV